MELAKRRAWIAGNSEVILGGTCLPMSENCLGKFPHHAWSTRSLIGQAVSSRLTVIWPALIPTWRKSRFPGPIRSTWGITCGLPVIH